MGTRVLIGTKTPVLGGQWDRILEKGAGLACSGGALGYALARRLSGG